jgi:hypothetical protein
MTPIPYKLVTISSGVAHFDLPAFIGASMASRSLRFFLIAGVLWWFGDAARDFIERRLTLVTSMFAVLLVGRFVALALSIADDRVDAGACRLMLRYRFSF